MPKNDSISMSVIRRLPRYYRFLSELSDQGVDKISSTKLAQIMNVTASQVRQDLNCFGGFGQQGYGYSVSGLRDEIKRILGLNNRYRAVLIGAGNFGSAIAKYLDFERLGFTLVACFDRDEQKIGEQLGDLTVRDAESLEGFCEEEHIDAAILCVPRTSVEGVLDRLYALGVRSFWNFSHYDISTRYPDAVIENVHLSDSLMTLCYRMNNSNQE